MAALAQHVAIDTIRRQFITVLQALAQDRVANIRMNVSKTIQAIIPVVRSQPQGNQDIIDALHALL